MHKAEPSRENRCGAGNPAGGRAFQRVQAPAGKPSPEETPSQEWPPHCAAHIVIIRCDAPGVMSNLCHRLRHADARLRAFFAAEAASQSDQADLQNVRARRLNPRDRFRPGRSFQMDARHRRLRAFEDDVLHLLDVDLRRANSIQHAG